MSLPKPRDLSPTERRLVWNWLTDDNVTCYTSGMAHDDLREFMMVVRDALLMVVRWIERKYGKTI